MGLAGHEIVLMFRLHDKLDLFLVFLQVYRHLNHGEALEVVQEFLGFIADEPLHVLTEVSMPHGDFDLHRLLLLSAGPSAGTASRKATWPNQRNSSSRRRFLQCP